MDLSGAFGRMVALVGDAVILLISCVCPEPEAVLVSSLAHDAPRTDPADLVRYP